MKTVFFALFTCLWMFACTTTTYAQDANGEKWQSVRFVKFKDGKAAEGMEIGRKYFAPAYEQAGYKLAVLEFTEGEWDAMIVVPLKNGPADKDQNTPKEVQQNLLNLAGGEAALNKVFERYNNAVDTEQWKVAKQW